MDRSEEVFGFLASHHIPYTLHRHEPMATIEACQGITGVDWSQAAMCKNIFLCNRQETQFYLVLLRHDHSFRTAVVSKLLGVSRLSFARQELLPDMLGLDAGAVSPLGLLFDARRAVQLVFDDKLAGYQRLLFHPCVNYLSLEMQGADFFHRFLPALGREAIPVTLTDD